MPCLHSACQVPSFEDGFQSHERLIQHPSHGCFFRHCRNPLQGGCLNIFSARQTEDQPPRDWPMASQAHRLPPAQAGLPTKVQEQETTRKETKSKSKSREEQTKICGLDVPAPCVRSLPLAPSASLQAASLDLAARARDSVICAQRSKRSPQAGDATSTSGSCPPSANWADCSPRHSQDGCRRPVSSGVECTYH